MVNEDNLDIQKSKLNARISEAQIPQTNIPSASPANKVPIQPSEFIPSEEPIETKPQMQMQNIDNLISDIDNSEKLKKILSGTDLDKFCDSNLSINPTINQTADTLRNINVIKDELCKLPLDPCEMDFITTNINPLLNILYQLSTTSYNLASSTNLLSISPIVHAKKSELKDTIHLTYKINDECEDIYDVLKRRINFILKNNA